MYKICTFLFLIIAFTLSVNAQKIRSKNVPPAVWKAFQTAHPKVKETDWTREGENYKVSFFDRKQDYMITYDGKGKLLLSEKLLWERDIPKNIRDYTRKTYPQYKIKEALIGKTFDNVISYEIKLNGVNLLFDETYNLVSASNN